MTYQANWRFFTTELRLIFFSQQAKWNNFPFLCKLSTNWLGMKFSIVKIFFLIFRTINSYFGSQFITSEGILLNNEMDDFSIEDQKQTNGNEPNMVSTKWSKIGNKGSQSHRKKESLFCVQWIWKYFTYILSRARGWGLHYFGQSNIILLRQATIYIFLQMHVLWL